MLLLCSHVCVPGMLSRPLILIPVLLPTPAVCPSSADMANMFRQRLIGATAPLLPIGATPDGEAVVHVMFCCSSCSSCSSCSYERSLKRGAIYTYDRYFLENNQDHQLTSIIWWNVAHRYTPEDEVDTPSMNYVGKALLL